MRTTPLFVCFLCVALGLAGVAAAQTDSLERATVGTHPVQDGRLHEVSGLVASREQDDVFWAHNDSGDDPVIYAIDGRGRTRATFALVGARHVDWEDIAIGSGPEPDVDYLYVADIGDNSAHRSRVTIYRVAEPDLEFVDPGAHHEVDDVARLDIAYEDGPRDAETLLVDPVARELVIVTKRSPEVHVYTTPLDGDWSRPRTLPRLRRIPFTNVVAGDLSADGRHLVLKTYAEVLYWRRADGATLDETLDAEPQRLPYHPEPQGEAVAWSPAADAYYTLSEERGGVPAVLYRYPREPR